ncbi:MAG: DUF6471 domain-containing protein [Methylocella sp.]
MGFAKTEREWAKRASSHLKAELKRADVTYEKLAKRLNANGFTETKASISNKLARATVPASFFLACLAALELEGVRLEDI